MEDLLRAYAKKRREEAGAPFELSPDVRARLRQEVRRCLGQIRRRAPAAPGAFAGRLAAAGLGRSGRRAGDFCGLDQHSAARLNRAICQHEYSAARVNRAVCEGGNMGQQRNDYFIRPARRRAHASASHVRASARLSRTADAGRSLPRKIACARNPAFIGPG